ncbi:hypothetical protein JRG42_02910 [Pseudomonas granadensis]|uniref:hypothetical protein n=1 Tax=Pseudomonas granadensis TaxID=1421430 RepID=UPI0019D10F7F|nr:hypothetical protein [Pseudomonas granadensis]MBN6771810.1 hypothetical protein [Pseudomonas granadensis]MBN6803414.1 hypothetical protein [Pseudomonas granadensis]MBN6829661.1 hypothetical protein [Pseudomonas granadensis]MBN6837635.1 hypothetical protein [Pseudomonas granadensis]MBN6866281.1 hypothetical protein [Pseudomonas granadensis]
MANETTITLIRKDVNGFFITGKSVPNSRIYVTLSPNGATQLGSGESYGDGNFGFTISFPEKGLQKVVATALENGVANNTRWSAVYSYNVA